MSGEFTPRIYTFTAFSGHRRYVSESTIKSLGKEKHISIVSNSKVWRAFQHYEEHQVYTERVFYPLGDKELPKKLKGALELNEVGERIAVVGFPYHRLSRNEKSIEFFFLMCENLITNLYNWYDKVVFVPPKPNLKWERGELLKKHDNSIQRLKSRFHHKRFEVLQQ